MPESIRVIAHDPLVHRPRNNSASFWRWMIDDLYETHRRHTGQRIGSVVEQQLHRLRRSWSCLARGLARRVAAGRGLQASRLNVRLKARTSSRARCAQKKCPRKERVPGGQRTQSVSGSDWTKRAERLPCRKARSFAVRRATLPLLRCRPTTWSCRSRSSSVADWLAHEAGRIWIPTDTVKGIFNVTFQHRKNLVMKHSPSAARGRILRPNRVQASHRSGDD